MADERKLNGSPSINKDYYYYYYYYYYYPAAIAMSPVNRRRKCEFSNTKCYEVLHSPSF